MIVSYNVNLPPNWRAPIIRSIFRVEVFQENEENVYGRVKAEAEADAVGEE
jgi:hypothetical protein